MDRACILVRDARVAMLLHLPADWVTHSLVAAADPTCCRFRVGVVVDLGVVTGPESATRTYCCIIHVSCMCVWAQDQLHCVFTLSYKRSEK